MPCLNSPQSRAVRAHRRAHAEAAGAHLRAQVVACISKGVSETMHLLETDEGQHDKLTDVTVRLVLYEQASPSTSRGRE